MNESIESILSLFFFSLYSRVPGQQLRSSSQCCNTFASPGSGESMICTFESISWNSQYQLSQFVIAMKYGEAVSNTFDDPRKNTFAHLH